MVNAIQILVRKCENDINFLAVQNKAFDSTPVKSVAIDVWMFVLHDVKHHL